MFVGPGVITTSVDIEHGANANPGQQSPVRAAAFPANFGVTGGQMPSSTTGFGDEKEEKKGETMGCAQLAQRGEHFILRGLLQPR
jgi:hypothetical protein